MARSKADEQEAHDTEATDHNIALAEEAGLTMYDPSEEGVREPTNAVLYGEPGVGKTFLALTAPKPVIIDLEKGAPRTAQSLKAHAAQEGWPEFQGRIIPINYVEGSSATAAMDAMNQLRTAFKFLAAGNHDFQTVIIDPFSELQKLIMAEVIEKYPAKRQMGNQPAIQDWGKAFDTAISLISMFRSLPMHTIFVAHTERRMNDEQELFPLVQGKKVGPYLEGAMDLLGYIYIQDHTDEETHVRSKTRVLQVTADGRVRAKNRGGVLPDLIADPNLSEIFALMEGRTS